jgi:hypothetical protein
LQRESNPEILSEEEASRLWERAAQLLAEASGTSEPTDVQTTALPPSGYSLEDVRSAALEASIGEKFFEAALVDLRSERTLPAVGRGGKLARKFLKNPPSTITVQRILEATPQTVFAAMEAVLPEEPFRLTLTDQEGDPLNQGLLVFNIPEVPSPLARGFAFEARDGGLQRIFISLRPIEGPTPSCEITVYSHVTSHKVGLGLGVLMGTLFGGAGYSVGWIGGIALGGVGVMTGLGPLAAVGGAVVGGAVGIQGFRVAYGSGMKRAHKALEGLVSAVGARAKGVWKPR